MQKPDEIEAIAREVANNFHDFWGPGSQAKTRRFEQALGEKFKKRFGEKAFIAQQKWEPKPTSVAKQKCEPEQTSWAFDFYFPGDYMAVEIALSGHTSGTEFFKDLWKVMLARQPDSNIPVQTLLIIGKSGIVKRLKEPFPASIMNLCKGLGFNVDVRGISQTQRKASTGTVSS